MNNKLITKWKFNSVDVAFVAIFIALLAIFYTVSVRPVLGRQKTIASQKRTLESQRRNTSQLAGRAGKLTEKLATARKVLKESPLQLQPVSTLNRRLARLTSMARSNGLKVDRVEQGDVVCTKRYDKVSINLTGSSGYSQWAKFLNTLPKRMPDVAVDTFELVGTPGHIDTPTYFRINLIWYAAPSASVAKK